jgi:hypothetical protein
MAGPAQGRDMNFDRYSAAKIPATLDDLRRRVAFALDRHPLCRNVEFDVVSMPRTRKSNWTVTLRTVAPTALWEASEIVADIQEAYELAAVA